jgi:hypothetical protein
MKTAIFLLTAMICAASDLASIRNEASLERRSELALDYANQAIDQAKEAYAAGDTAKTEAALGELKEAVDVAYDALSNSGKDPRKDKFHKRAELRTRELIRRLDGLAQTVSFEDRDAVSRIRDHVAEVHDNLLKGIMSKKK